MNNYSFHIEMENHVHFTGFIKVTAPLFVCYVLERMMDESSLNFINKVIN
jgi:hypothetical protein